MLTCNFQIRFNNSPRKLSQCLNSIIATERRRHATVILWKKELVSLTLIGVHRGQASVMKNTTQISPIKWLFNVFKLEIKTAAMMVSASQLQRFLTKVSHHWCQYQNEVTELKWTCQICKPIKPCTLIATLVMYYSPVGTTYTWLII